MPPRSAAASPPAPCGSRLVVAAATRWRLRALTVGLWALPLLASQLAFGPGAATLPPYVIALAVIVVLAVSARRIEARYRHGSQAFRLTMMTLGLLVPAVAFYPSMFHLGRRPRHSWSRHGYAPQAVNHRQTVQQLLQESLDDRSRFPA